MEWAIQGAGSAGGEVGAVDFPAGVVNRPLALAAERSVIVTMWRAHSRRTDHQWEGDLVAYWEVHRDPISDDYTPDEITARDLFSLWVDRVRYEFPNCLVPIHWFVGSSDQGKFERMPSQFDHFPDMPRRDFLTAYEWPVDVATGERLNWPDLPVVDKFWNSARADKGGFIQQATGWKPSILQPHVFLPALIAASHSGAVCSSS